MPLLFFFIIFAPLTAAGTGQTVAAGAANPPLDLNVVQEYIERLDTEVKGSVPQLNFKDMVARLVKGEAGWQPAEIFKNILKQLFKEVVANFDLLGKLVILAVICAVMQNLISSFEKGSAGQLTYAVTYLVLITIAIGSFSLAVNAGREVVNTMVTFMQALLPVLLTLLVAVGGI
ncbi:MAG: stage III sporulation protein AE, partial [Peptococcaceae bacterium]|nr:stage III sporulation protein AE [Peptococcaceae bacterium]